MGVELQRVCVFCGSSFGARDSYRQAAVALGRALLDADLTLVYGGASVGLMGAVADAVLDGGGEVIGVIPTFLLEHEIHHESLTELVVVESMAERKDRMAELSDGFVALPGGLGTLEELFEMVVWSQLHLHHKPVGILDIDGFYTHLRSFLRHATEERLIREENLELLLFDDDVGSLLDRMRGFDPQPIGKWLDES